MSDTEADIFNEPACWGSGETVLVPISLENALRGVTLKGARFVGTERQLKKNEFRSYLELDIFTKANWIRPIRGFAFDFDHSLVVDRVVEELHQAVEANPDSFDLPVLTKPLDRIDGVMSLPFECRTWDLLDRLGVNTPVDLVTLILGTFREIHDRLGDTKSALDVSVTSDSWLVQAPNGSWSFSIPATSSELEELKKFARIRTFRTCGIDPSSSSYSLQFADVLPRHWSVAQSESWTLEKCGDELGLTRERVRQVSKNRLLSPARRRWTLSPALLDLHDEYRARCHEPGDPELSTSIQMLRSEAKALLLAYGYSERSLRSVASLPEELKGMGYRYHEIRRVAYQSTERIGFVTEDVLKDRLQEEFPNLKTSLLYDVLATLIGIRNLPHGYVYVEGVERSFFVNDVSRLLGLRGRLPIEEVYEAANRFYKARVPRYVFPPRAVIRDFFQRNERFRIEDEFVDLVEPSPYQLTGVQLWVEERINEATGGVIHRSTLRSLARRDSISPGTLNVYWGYSMYFKPAGRGCLTHTGSFPSDEMIEIAAAKGAMIRVPPRLIDWRVEGDSVIVDLEVGTELVDSGLFSPPAAIRRMVQPRAFRVLADGVQRGNLGWSGDVLYGFSSGLFARRVEPGDQLRLVFDILAGTVEIMASP